VKIQNNVSVYKGVTIEKNVFLGPSVVFTNVINPRSFISRKDEFRPTIVREGATIGANSTIICGIEIGTYALVGAGSVVTKNIPAFSTWFGNPAKHKGWVSKEGYKLIFNEKSIAVCPSSREKYVLRKGEVIILNN
jgi:UDP-2-acetamido-3-amino-2,3-dideoxy-glucuronate N-acetyltransferase